MMDTAPRRSVHGSCIRPDFIQMASMMLAVPWPLSGLRTASETSVTRRPAAVGTSSRCSGPTASTADRNCSPPSGDQAMRVTHRSTFTSTAALSPPAAPVTRTSTQNRFAVPGRSRKKSSMER